MGYYFNPTNSLFAEALRSKIYVDKTRLISYTNEVISTEQKNLCVSRPRRFGKSMAANMLVAYYSKGCDSRTMFQGLKISQDVSFTEHLNCHEVLFLNMQSFLGRDKSKDMIDCLQQTVLGEMCEIYEVSADITGNSLVTAFEKLYKDTGKKFVFIIDEWDCIFREQPDEKEAQTEYLNFLQDLLKGKPYVELAYMTGILPIKKYGTHSALNMFEEFSMTDAGFLAPFVGFTEQEVFDLCERFQMDFAEAKSWYDGYRFLEASHIYSPKSVVDAMRRGAFRDYWTQTETYEALKTYIDMNFDGLKDAITMMLGGGRAHINSRKFQNDMTTFRTKDDVLTLLVHLGYLAYDSQNEEVYIPNREIADEFAEAVDGEGWETVAKAISDSNELLEATWRLDEERVAAMIDFIHMENTSILNYNDENALGCVISIAYYSAKNYYTLIREIPTGKGFADIVFLPKKGYSDKPALIIELKWNDSAEGALSQIKKRKYAASLDDYRGNTLLIGINYDKRSKRHRCLIEKLDMNEI